MYNPSPQTTIVIPFKQGSEDDLGKKVTDDYFGKVPPEHLIVEDDVLFMRGDGTRRGKIGVNDRRSTGVAGSYDAVGQVLTLVTYNVQDGPNGYVNSTWELQDAPYGGDVINAYNDGSPEPGAPPLGPFYELETSSPAAALAPGESMRHVQQTLHLQGDPALLTPIARAFAGREHRRDHDRSSDVRPRGTGPATRRVAGPVALAFQGRTREARGRARRPRSKATQMIVDRTVVSILNQHDDRCE